MPNQYRYYLNLLQLQHVQKIQNKKNMQVLICFWVIMIVGVYCSIHHYTKQQISQRISQTSITYGSTIRIKANLFTYHLHSHLVNYPSGSGLQSVTGMAQQHDYNSLWRIKQAHQQKAKTYMEEIKCGESIRLQHALSHKNLHSQEMFLSIITQGQEVSAFGNNGNGDDNDNWIIKCVDKQNGEILKGEDVFELIHQNTQKYLKMSRYYQYTFNNWENCPFEGQLEVSASPTSTKETQFKIVGGIFFKEKQQKQSSQQSISEQL